MKTTASWFPEKTWRRALPPLALFDFFGLLLAVWVVTIKIASPEPLFLVVLISFAVISWLFAIQFRSLHAIFTKVNYRTAFLAPSLAALGTLMLQALLRSYYSGTALILFIVFWTLWMSMFRLVYSRYSQAPTALVINSPNFHVELGRYRQISVTNLRRPPDTFNFDVAVIDPSKTYDDEWLQWLSHAEMSGVKVITAPRVLEALTHRVPLEMLNGRWAYRLFNGESSYIFWKRGFDILFVVLASPLLLLLCSIIALVVYFDSGRPILFWQKRIGKGAVPFMMVKFRSMCHDAEANGAAFTSHGDPRITRTGAFLRKFRLDEIPQFWNVLRGEMSVVGPRPEQEGFSKQFEDAIPFYVLRYNVRPGITGWSHVMQGYASETDEMSERIRYDLYYIKHHSLALDVKVVLRTVLILLTGFGSR